MGFKDHMEACQAEPDPRRGIKGMTPAEVVAAIKQENEETFHEFGLPWANEDPDVPKVRHG